MPVLLVTYDLKKPGQDYSKLLPAIKEYPWARLSESSYAIDTPATPQAVFNHLVKFIDSNDTIYIIALNQPFYGHGPLDVNKWLSEHLK